jgi:Na+/alanine symporter
MKLSWFSFYNITLALWVGGIALFTFIVTPVIFKSYPRDQAGEIVGRLFPGYFLYNLVLAALVLVLFVIVANDQSKLAYRLSFVCVVTALLINLFIVFKLHPEAVRIKQQVTSFEREAPDSPARKQFRRLHGVSAVLNLVLLAEGIVLLITGPLVRK